MGEWVMTTGSGVRALIACTCLMTAALVTAVAQQAPRRPRLARDADTNDASAYFNWGLERLTRVPEQAAAAFYWAERLDPASPQTLYARYVALHIADRDRLGRYLERDRAVLNRPEVRRIDSLYHQALMLDPFLHQGLEEIFLLRGIEGMIAARPTWTGNDGPAAGDIARAMDTIFATVNPYLRGTLAAGRGNHREALHYYSRALTARRIRADVIHAARARSFHALRQYDSAQAALVTALSLARAADTAALRFVYESRATWEFALARAYEDGRNYAAAREAYQRTLAEDLAYFPAHIRLGLLALALRDTAAALTELERAVATFEGHYQAQATLGAVYGRLGRREAAIRHLHLATRLEPWASATWYLLGHELEAAGDAAAADTAYTRFLALARRGDNNTVTVRANLNRLREASRP
jgi:tetratricopeptide (TPR) repeat protein